MKSYYGENNKYLDKSLSYETITKSVIELQPIEKKIIIDALMLKKKQVEDVKWIRDHIPMEDQQFIEKVDKIIKKIKDK